MQLYPENSEQVSRQLGPQGGESVEHRTVFLHLAAFLPLGTVTEQGSHAAWWKRGNGYPCDGTVTPDGFPPKRGISVGIATVLSSVGRRDGGEPRVGLVSSSVHWDLASICIPEREGGVKVVSGDALALPIT